MFARPKTSRNRALDKNTGTLQVLVVSIVGASVLALHAAEEQKPRKRFWLRPKKDAEVVVVSTLAFMDQNKDGVVNSGEFYEHVTNCGKRV